MGRTLRLLPMGQGHQGWFSWHSLCCCKVSLSALISYPCGVPQTSTEATGGQSHLLAPGLQAGVERTDPAGEPTLGSWPVHRMHARVPSLVR